jgi:hypothetical protein
MQAPPKATCGNGRKSKNGKRNIDATRTTAFTMKLIASALTLAGAWLVATASAQAQQRRPLVLAKSSYFFVGGKIDPSVEGSAMVGQMYVEYMIPQRQTHRYPIVMVHADAASRLPKRRILVISMRVS